MRTIFLLSFLLISFSGLFAGAPHVAEGQGYYTVTFPNDTTIYGCGAAAPVVQPVISPYGQCNFGVGVSYQDEVFFLNGSSSCYKIARRWRLLWWCDYHPTYTPTIIPNPTHTDQGPTVDAHAVNHGFLEYTQIIKVLDGEAPVITGCPTDALDFCDITDNNPQFWNASYWWDAATGKHDLCERPVDLPVLAFDSCTGTNLKARYLLLLDLDNNGSMETVVSSTNPPAPGTIAAGNAQNPNYTGGNVQVFDHRPVSANLKYRFAVETGTDPTTGGFFAAARWNTEQAPGQFVQPELPAGKHKIKWFIEDGCGNTASCEYSFVIRDCKAPTVVCINGLSTNLMQTGMVTLADTSFIHYLADNCTPVALIRTGIRKAGAGTGFPQNSHSVTFDCTEMGKQEVEVWAIDADGNADFCKTFVDVQDNMGVCKPSNKFGGHVAGQNLKPLPGMPVWLKKAGQTTGLAVSDALGNYLFDPQAAGCGYTVAPHFDTLPLAGVNTLDVLLTALHQSQILTINNPYALLAADADGNGLVNQADATVLIQLLLGDVPSFPGLPSWQFVDQAYTFPAGLPVPQPFCLTPDASPVFSFIGVKTGDVNASAQTQLTQQGSEDRQEYANYSAGQIRLTAGQSVRVPVFAPQTDNLAGMQLVLGFDPEALALRRVEPALVPVDWIRADAEKHRISASWHSVDVFGRTPDKNAGREMFVLHFTALQDGLLSDYLFLDSERIAPEVYNVSLQTLPAGLTFERRTARRESFWIDQIRPNPASDRVQVSCYAPEPCEVRFRWVDANGQVRGTENRSLTEGDQVLSFDLPATSPGMLFLHADGAHGNAVMQVVRE